MRLRFDKYFRLAVSFIALLLLLPTLVSAQSVITGGTHWNCHRSFRFGNRGRRGES